MTRSIFVTTDFIGFHRWADAPKVVSFLRCRHRHLFKVKVWVDVNHNDRDKEFFIVQDHLNELIGDYVDMNHEDVGSCEMICEYLLDVCPDYVAVQVSEDGENGAIISR